MIIVFKHSFVLVLSYTSINQSVLTGFIYVRVIKYFTQAYSITAISEILMMEPLQIIVSTAVVVGIKSALKVLQ